MGSYLKPVHSSPTSSLKYVNCTVHLFNHHHGFAQQGHRRRKQQRRPEPEPEPEPEPRIRQRRRLHGQDQRHGGRWCQGRENEDGLDKAVDYMQEKFLGQGDQSNESAAEQAKDEAISDFIRDKYKESTGKEFFVADKDKKFGA